MPMLLSIQGMFGTSRSQVEGVDFVIRGVLPGRYFLQAGERNSSQSNWTLKAATMRGLDVLDVPIDLAAGMEVTDLELTLTDRITELSGTISDLAGQPLGEKRIVVFSADSRHWWPGSRRVAVTGSDGTGRYSVRRLPPGDYRVAVTNDYSEDWSSIPPRLLTSSTRLTLAEGERKTQDLRMAAR